MARVTVEDCMQKINNRFALVILAAKRARQLLEGAPPVVPSKNKICVTALREVASGKVYPVQDLYEELKKYSEDQKVLEYY